MEKFLDNTRKKLVYIPHWLIRYEEETGNSKTGNLFIFLIGWFDTGSRDESDRLDDGVYIPHWLIRYQTTSYILNGGWGLYSSLVDSIRSLSMIISSITRKFIFLIGWFDTSLRANLWSRPLVYIPHWLIRYHVVYHYDSAYTGFIFLIGWFDTQPCSNPLIRRDLFIFLIGWFDTLSSRDMIRLRWRLYSSLVDSIRDDPSSQTSENMFIFLIGWFDTDAYQDHEKETLSRLYSSLVDSIPFKIRRYGHFPGLYSSLVDSIPSSLSRSILFVLPGLYSSLVDSIQNRLLLPSSGSLVYIPHWLIRYRHVRSIYRVGRLFIFLIGWFDTFGWQLDVFRCLVYIPHWLIRYRRPIDDDDDDDGLYSSLVDSIPFPVPVSKPHDRLYSSLVDSILNDDIYFTCTSCLYSSLVDSILNESHIACIVSWFIFLIGWFDTLIGETSFVHFFVYIPHWLIRYLAGDA